MSPPLLHRGGLSCGYIAGPEVVVRRGASSLKTGSGPASVPSPPEKFSTLTPLPWHSPCGAEGFAAGHGRNGLHIWAQNQ